MIDERLFGWTDEQWKEWKKLWRENGAYLGDSRRKMSDEERAEWYRKQDEVTERNRRVERALEAKEQGLVGNSYSETTHDRFYGIIRESERVMVLTPEQEETAQKFNRWLEHVEDASEVTGE